MATRPPGRSVKIGEDERTGFSSDRPREGGRVRPPDLRVNCRVLAPADRLRYSPGSLLLVARELVDDEDRGALNELRRALDAGELGAEGIQTALRLGGGTAEEVKRILFRPPPREEP